MGWLLVIFENFMTILGHAGSSGFLVVIRCFHSTPTLLNQMEEAGIYSQKVEEMVRLPDEEIMKIV